MCATKWSNVHGCTWHVFMTAQIRAVTYSIFCHDRDSRVLKMGSPAYRVLLHGFHGAICKFTTQNRPADHSPGSWKELKHFNHDISSGTQIAYRIHLLSKDETGNSPDIVGLDKLSPEIQKVLQKHSAEGGTFAGTIPPHTHAIGFECNIELIEGC